ncbi:MAG: hypothetical protein PWR01_3951 [Clostridiales bacterium]|nr:hypothetical protein [Clostridiales bacterium]MDN5282878.1 hypothetical protein [Candidatus Ozemobacter sp.]
MTISESYKVFELRLRENLINNLLVTSALVGTWLFIIVQLRTMSIGWSERDLIQAICILTILFFAIYRKRFSTRIKAFFLVLSNLIAGLAGVLSFSFLAGGVFLIPVAAIVASLFFTGKEIVVFSTILVLFFITSAISFLFNFEKVIDFAKVLSENHFYFVSYFSCFVYFLIVTCMTIMNFRRVVKELIDEIFHQSSEIENKNEQLVVVQKTLKTLSGLLPICSSCKKIRDDKGYWNQLELYIKDHSEAEFSHGICPDCFKTLYTDDFNDYVDIHTIESDDKKGLKNE